MMLAEWAPQWGIMMAWPHKTGLWQDALPELDANYAAIARHLLADGNLLLLCRDLSHEAHIRACLGDIETERLHIKHLSCNSSWTRSYGPIPTPHRLVDFAFNAWGNCFPHKLDNAVNKRLYWTMAMEKQRMVLEAGSIETDGQGCLLTTSSCLLNTNRNLHMKERKPEHVERILGRVLGINEIVWLDHGQLAGDPTGGHIDNLVRFVDEKTLAYLQCTNPSDSHYVDLQSLETVLKTQASQHGWTLLPIPQPPPIQDNTGNRLPASHLGFLFTNQRILVPLFGTDTDDQAIKQLQTVAGQRDVTGVDCRALLQHRANLHAVAMQLPAGSRE